MKLLIAAMILFSTTAFAEPFLVCDPDPNATEYKIEWASGATEYVNAPLHYDAYIINEGDNSGHLYAGRPWQVDGVDQEAFEWSAPFPFLLTRPSKPASPIGIRLSK